MIENETREGMFQEQADKLNLMVKAYGTSGVTEVVKRMNRDEREDLIKAIQTASSESNQTSALFFGLRLFNSRKKPSKQLEGFFLSVDFFGFGWVFFPVFVCFVELLLAFGFGVHDKSTIGKSCTSEEGFASTSRFLFHNVTN